MRDELISEYPRTMMETLLDRNWFDRFLLSGTKKVPLLLGMGVIPCVCLIGIVCLLKYRTAKKNAVAEKLSREQKYLGMDLITKEEPVSTNRRTRQISTVTVFM